MGWSFKQGLGLPKFCATLRITIEYLESNHLNLVQVDQEICGCFFLWSEYMWIRCYLDFQLKYLKAILFQSSIVFLTYQSNFNSPKESWARDLKNRQAGNFEETGSFTPSTGGSQLILREETKRTMLQWSSCRGLGKFTHQKRRFFFSHFNFTKWLNPESCGPKLPSGPTFTTIDLYSDLGHVRLKPWRCKITWRFGFSLTHAVGLEGGNLGPKKDQPVINFWGLNYPYGS